MRNLIIIIFLFSLNNIFGQKWITPKDFPTHQERYDDIFFVDDKEGWVVSGYGTVGILLHTLDGGLNWDTIYTKEYSHFRSIYFFDKNNGVLATVGADVYPGGLDTIPLYYTTDGGKSFIPSNITGDKVEGICNFYKKFDILFAAGRVGGGSFFCKSKDMGKTWFAEDLSEYLGTAISLYFKNYQQGFIFGGTSKLIKESRPIILYTNDSALSWDTVALSPNVGGLVWKMQFVNDSVAYATVLDHKNESTFFKTTDGGVTWELNPLVKGIYTSKGLYFENELQGFIGGDDKQNAAHTNDGGLNWRIDKDLGPSINRILKLKDNNYIAIGKTLWLFDEE